MAGDASPFICIRFAWGKILTDFLGQCHHLRIMKSVCQVSKGGTKWVSECLPEGFFMPNALIFAQNRTTIYIYIFFKWFNQFVGTKKKLLLTIVANLETSMTQIKSDQNIDCRLLISYVCIKGILFSKIFLFY